MPVSNQEYSRLVAASAELQAAIDAFKANAAAMRSALESARDFIAVYDDEDAGDDVRKLLRQCRMALGEPRWIGGYNMPGYLPDSEPMEFDTYEEAKRYLIECIKRHEDETENEEEAETLCAFAEDVNLQSGEFAEQCGNLVYWIARER